MTRKRKTEARKKRKLVDLDYLQSINSNELLSGAKGASSKGSGFSSKIQSSNLVSSSKGGNTMAQN